MSNEWEYTLKKERIVSLLRPELQNSFICCYDSVDSTNHQAKLAAEQGCFGPAIFAANSQTAGRGRLGRSFYSPENTGIYFSFLFSSAAPLAQLTAVTPAAAVATSIAIEKNTGRSPGIKWVNDLFLNGKKICGILTEAVTSEERKVRVIVGIGINLYTADFPEEIRESAGAIGQAVDRNALIAEIVNRLYDFFLRPENRAFMKEYTARSIVIGKSVQLLRGEEVIKGVVLGFDADGGLLLDTGDASPRLFTGGEISLRLD